MAGSDNAAASTWNRILIVAACILAALLLAWDLKVIDFSRTDVSNSGLAGALTAVQQLAENTMTSSEVLYAPRAGDDGPSTLTRGTALPSVRQGRRFRRRGASAGVHADGLHELVMQAVKDAVDDAVSKQLYEGVKDAHSLREQVRAARESVEQAEEKAQAERQEQAEAVAEVQEAEEAAKAAEVEQLPLDPPVEKQQAPMPEPEPKPTPSTAAVASTDAGVGLEKTVPVTTAGGLTVETFTVEEGTPRCKPNPWDDNSYRSLGKTSVFKGGNLEDEGVLEEIIMTRSYNCELIVFAANEGGTLMAANSIYNMHRFGWDHYLLIVSSEAQCKKLRESPLQISCAWTTFLKEHKGIAPWGVPTCDHCADAFHLWISRIHYLAKFVDLGINAMYMDNDVAMTADFYRVMKAPPMARHNLILQMEVQNIHGLNIGVIYCQNCAPGGRGAWVLHETVRRIIALLDMDRPEDIYKEDEEAGVVQPKYTMTGAKNTLWDQHTLNDVVETSVTGIESRRRSYSISLRNEDRDVWFKHHGYHTRDVSWVDDQGIFHRVLTLPPAADEETVVGAPPYIIGGWAGVAGDRLMQGVTGLWNNKVAPLAHFVGCPDKAGGFKALGWWDYRSEEINAIVHGKPPPPSLPQRRYLTVKGPSFEYKDLKKFHDKYFTAVGRLLVLAILSDRRAVAPPIPCSSGWITSRVPESWHGIDQAPYRSDWHPGERVWNGIQTSKCRFQPGPQEGDPAGVCCTPWITQQVKCPLVSTHVELNHVLQEFPDVAKGAAEVAVDTAAQVKYTPEELLMGTLDSNANALYVTLPGEQVPVVKLGNSDLQVLKAKLGDECHGLRKMLQKDYPGI